MQNKITRYVRPQVERFGQDERGMAVAEYAIGVFVIAAVLVVGMNMLDDVVPNLMETIIKAAFGKF